MFKEIYQNYILKNYKIIIIGSVIILFIIVMILIGYHNHKKLEVLPKQNEIVSNEMVKEDEPKEKVVIKDLYVDIKGAINKPDVYKLQDGARIIDVINMAGGLIDTADTSLLNLSKKVTDEMVIIIYTKDEINAFKKNNETKEEVIKYIEKECVCPDPSLNGACANEESDTVDTPDSSLISLNTATKDQLMTLSGIGESKANSIIEYRTLNGPFKSIEDLKNITGIGDSIFDQIKDYITI